MGVDKRFFEADDERVKEGVLLGGWMAGNVFGVGGKVVVCNARVGDGTVGLGPSWVK